MMKSTKSPIRTPQQPKQQATTSPINTNPELQYLTEKIEQKEKELNQYLQTVQNHRQKQSENNSIKKEDEQKLAKYSKIEKIFKEYQKLLPASLKSNKNSLLGKASSGPSLYDLTIEALTNKQNRISDLDNEIQMYQNRLQQIKSEISHTKNQLQEIKISIPEFRQLFTNSKFESWIDSYSKSELATIIAHKKFFKNEIHKSKLEIRTLSNQIQALTPAPATLRITKFDHKPSSPVSKNMRKCKSLEESKLREILKKSRNTLNEAQIRCIYSSTQNAKVVKKRIKQNLNQVNNLFQYTQKNLNTLHSTQGIQIQSFFEKERETAKRLKESIAANKAELELIRPNIPDLDSASPEGLLKWRDQLKRQLTNVGNQYNDDIKRARINFQNHKLIVERRLSALKSQAGSA